MARLVVKPERQRQDGARDARPCSGSIYEMCKWETVKCRHGSLNHERQDVEDEITTHPNITSVVPASAVVAIEPSRGEMAEDQRRKGARPREVLKTLSRRGVTRNPAGPRSLLVIPQGRAQISRPLETVHEQQGGDNERTAYPKTTAGTSGTSASRRLNRVEASWRRISVGKSPSQTVLSEGCGVPVGQSASLPTGIPLSHETLPVRPWDGLWCVQTASALPYWYTTGTWATGVDSRGPPQASPR
ncbi:hypothetical protein C8R47DRAFT_1063888 [Mycena vitilis]|nr:hypothetical protein C8R47DRAFT_1063888 [Mycena vitilis]